MTDRWDIRTEPFDGFSFSPKGRVASESGMRIKYRPLGKRGRFESFVIVGPCPDARGLQEVVSKYDAARSER